jgi:multicomponent Na+:H+ antiporter subunit E
MLRSDPVSYRAEPLLNLGFVLMGENTGTAMMQAPRGAERRGDAEINRRACSTAKHFEARSHAAELLFGLWLILSRFQPTAFLVGIFAAGMATWVSLRLLPLGRWRLRPRALAAFGLRFLGQSMSAGIDVAWRAFSPQLTLLPGFVIYRPRLPEGSAQTAFCTVMSLVPGTLPSGRNDAGGVVIHCLDVERPVVAQSAVEEELLARAFGVPLNDG